MSDPKSDVLAFETRWKTILGRLSILRAGGIEDDPTVRRDAERLRDDILAWIQGAKDAKEREPYIDQADYVLGQVQAYLGGVPMPARSASSVSSLSTGAVAGTLAGGIIGFLIGGPWIGAAGAFAGAMAGKAMEKVAGKAEEIEKWLKLVLVALAVLAGVYALSSVRSAFASR